LRASAGFEQLAAATRYLEVGPSFWLWGAERENAQATELEFDGVRKGPFIFTPREGFLLSTIVHLLVLLVLIVKPDLIPLRSSADASAVRERERLVMIIPPPPPPNPSEPPPATPAEPITPPPSSAVLIPKATRPAPPDKVGEFQNDLPFAEGDTDEFATDRESGKPGDPGPASVENGRPEDAAAAEPSAMKLPLDRFSFRDRPPRPLASRAPPPREDPGRDGERAPFEDLRRFLRDKQFHNPEGGLFTGRDNTLYYNDQGANFVPWLRRMLTEVKRNWIVPYAAAFEAGHVAVGVSVLRDGSIDNLKVLVPSGTPGFDNAALGALQASRLLPLPSDYPDQRFEFILVFWYNEQPYDIF
jgi:TonB family protein